jgi:hypothetical protein
LQQDEKEESTMAATSQTNPLATATNPNKRPRPRRIKQSSLGLPTNQEEFFHVQTKYGTPDGKSDPWQVRLLSFLNSKGMQHFLIGLLMLDVTILFIELALDAFFPSCYIVQRDAVSCCPGDNENTHYSAAVSRLLEGADGHDELCEAPLMETSYQAGCDDHKYHGVHVVHDVLFSLTILILSIFEVELLTMMYLIGVDKFFVRVLYIVDLFIVTVSLVLEILFRTLHNQIASDLIGILIFFRLWRFVRIGHGLIASTYEMQEEKLEMWKEYVEELEKIVKRVGENLPQNKPHSFSDENEQEREPARNL